MTYSVILPEPCEKDFWNPFYDWEKNKINKKGVSYAIDKIRSTFYYCFLFTVASSSKDITPAMAGENTTLRRKQSSADNAMNAANITRLNYMQQQPSPRRSSPWKKSHQSKSRHRSKSRQSRSRCHSRRHSCQTPVFATRIRRPY